MDFPLSKPIQAHGQTISSLTLREEVTAGDLFKAGIPYKLETGREGTTRLVFEPTAVRAMIAQLASIPTSSVDLLTASEFMQLADLIVGFMTPSQSKS
jgi:hypothetical protein